MVGALFKVCQKAVEAEPQKPGAPAHPQSLATADIRGYALAIEQDPVDRDLLFLGTEFGLFVSTDGGARWLPFRHGLPTTSVMALAIQPREADLHYDAAVLLVRAGRTSEAVSHLEMALAIDPTQAAARHALDGLAARHD